MEIETQASVALIIGITGMVGLSLAEALKHPEAPAGPWTVYGVARHAMPTWFNPHLVDHYLELDLLNSKAVQRELSPISDKVSHVFWLTLIHRRFEEDNIQANMSMVTNVLEVLAPKNASETHLRHFSIVTGTKHYIGPIFDPVLSSQVVPHEPPFHENLPRLPFPNVYYSIEDLLASYSHIFTFSVHRSSMILGASSRSGLNLLLNLAVYALICRQEGSPFRFPGSKFSWEHIFVDTTDADLLAKQQIWAVVSDKATNQAFNCSNGDVFTWKGIWKLLCEIFNVEFIPFDETEKVGVGWIEEMKRKGRVWDAIVEENKLVKLRFEEVIQIDAMYIMFNMKMHHVCSMTKSREFGFHEFAHTTKRVRRWIAKLQEMNIIPTDTK